MTAERTQHAAMLWTGGKDSALALFEALRHGLDVRCLVTFAPLRPEFRAHPLEVIERQADALGLPHHVVRLGAPFEHAYEAALARLAEGMGIDCVVTGDIAEVDGQPNWIAERCRAVGLGARMPLWGCDREALLRRVLGAGFKALISCVDTRRLDAAWVGRELDAAAIAELCAIRARNGLDPCGEQGEYHTIVLDGPLYNRPVELRSRTVRSDGQLAWLDVRDTTPAEAAA